MTEPVSQARAVVRALPSANTIFRVLYPSPQKGSLLITGSLVGLATVPERFRDGREESLVSEAARLPAICKRMGVVV